MVYQKTKRILYNNTKKEETGEQESKYGIKINNFEINFNQKGFQNLKFMIQ